MANVRRKRTTTVADERRNGPPIVYVHGIGAQLPPDELRHEWDLALFGQDMGTRTKVAYWADLMHRESAVEDVGPTTRSARRTGQTIDVQAALAQVGLADDERAEALAHDLLFVLGVPSARQPNGRRGVGKRVLPLPEFLRRPLSRLFLQAFIGDTAAYFFDADLQRKMRDRFLAQLPRNATDPVIVVAHSQGSIIAYDVLRKTKRNVQLLMTLGSPLGIQEVQDHLGPPLAVPEWVAAWHNASDPLDPVAVDHGLANDFKPAGTIRDMLLRNGETRIGFGFNPHSSVGYLAHPKVREIVHRAAQLDAMRRFVVARDVADKLGAPDVRVPVLIEVLEPGYPAIGKEEKDPALVAEREKAETRMIRAARRPRHGTVAEVTADEPSLQSRVNFLAGELKRFVGEREKDVDVARIDCLRRFVAAHLTAAEIRHVARQHQQWRVYSVWRSSVKRRMLHRSAAVLQAPAARETYQAGGRGITWAVLDTGVKQRHPHFAKYSNVSKVWDCTRPGRPRLIPPGDRDEDRDGHGTHVSGIIAGTSPDGSETALSGLAPQAKLVVYKVLNDKGEGEDAWIIKALDHIAEQNENNAGIAIHGVNLSLGGPFDSTVYGCGFSPICVELRRLWRQGVLVCVASGNEGELQIETADGDFDLHTQISIGDPANLEDCIAVGSVHADKPHLYGISSFSSRGPTADGRAKPDVVAPGERILSCNARFRGTNNLYYQDSGTSMATPHVSGLLAAFLSVRSEFRGRPDEVKQILLRTCTDLGRDRYHQGRGMPNLMKMLLET